VFGIPKNALLTSESLDMDDGEFDFDAEIRCLEDLVDQLVQAHTLEAKVEAIMKDRRVGAFFLTSRCSASSSVASPFGCFLCIFLFRQLLSEALYEQPALFLLTGCCVCLLLPVIFSTVPGFVRWSILSVSLWRTSSCCTAYPPSTSGRYWQWHLKVHTHRHL
jgi:hypothetical protein